MTPQKINIVCIGVWNNKIFTPSWVANNAFRIQNPDEELQGIFNPDDMLFGYQYKNISIFPKSSALEIELSDFGIKTTEFAITVYNNIITVLPHTPKKATGINIIYNFNKNIKCSLIDNLNIPQSLFLDYTINRLILSKPFEFGHSNIIISIMSDNYIVEFNYHFVKNDKIDIDFINKYINVTQKILFNEK